jgi:uncharacterized protein YndB with AHSA1/START domain
MTAMTVTTTRRVTRTMVVAAVCAAAARSGAASRENRPADDKLVPIEARAPGRAITFDLTLDKPPAEVLRLWSTAEGVKSFLAPGAIVEPRVGGLYQVTFDPEGDPEGTRHGTHGARVLRVVEGSEIAFEWTFPPLGVALHTKPYPTWVEVRVEPSDARPGGTRLRFAHRGFPSGGKWDDALRLFRDGNWPLVLNRLVVLCRDGQRAFDNGLRTTKGEPESFDRIIVKSASVAAPVDEVWKAWTTLEGVTSFFAPQARVEARPGGAYEMYFNPSAPAGSRGGEGCKVLSLDPPRLFAFDWNAPPSLPGVRAQRTIVNVQLEPAAGGGVTEVRLTALGWGHGAEWEQAHAYFERAWGQVLEWLVRRYAPPTPAPAAPAAKE